MSDPLRIAIYLHERKKARFQPFVALCREQGHEVIETDLMSDLAVHRPSIVLHKITDDLTEEVLTGPAKTRVETLDKFAKEHPEVPIVDPVSNLFKLLDRQVMYSLLSSLPLPPAFAGKIKVPEFVKIESKLAGEELEKILGGGEGGVGGVEGPFLCKTVRACGSVASHVMTICPSVSDIASAPVEYPMCILRYVNHGATLWKVYVLGSFSNVVSRESTPDLTIGQQAVTFDSQKLSKKPIPPPDGSEPPSKELIELLTKAINKHIGVTLFGFDLIREGTDIWHIIDINYFPTYEGVDQMEQLLLDHLKDIAKQSQ